MNLICKLFNFLLALFINAVEGVAYALQTVGEIALDLLGGVLNEVGDLVGLSGGTIGLIGAGLLLFFIVRNKGGSDEQRYTERAGNRQTTG